jgi:hypothetical protein
MKAVQVVIAIAGLAAVVFGVSQIFSGVEEMKGSKAPTKGDAKAIADEAAANLKEYVDEERGIAFSYPKNWVTERPTGSPLFFKWKTLKGAVNCSAMSEELPSGATLVDYVKLNREQILAQLTKDKMTPDGFDQDPVQVGGEPGLRLRFSYTLPEPKLKVRQTQAYFVHGNRAYSICLTTEADMHESFDGLMARILASVRFPG